MVTSFFFRCAVVPVVPVPPVMGSDSPVIPLPPLTSSFGSRSRTLMCPFFIRRQTDCITLILMFLFSASIADYFVTVFVLGCQRRRKRFAVRADEKLTTLVDLEAAIAARQI